MSEPMKPRVVVYFAQGREAMAKDLAGRMRAMDNVDVTLVWANNFLGPEHVYRVGACVIQKGVANESKIVDSYLERAPETQIHFVDEDGDWVENADEESTAQDIAVQGTGETETDSGVQGSIEGEDAGSVEASGSVEPEDAAPSGSDAEQAREA